MHQLRYLIQDEHQDNWGLMWQLEVEGKKEKTCFYYTANTVIINFKNKVRRK